MMRCSEMRWDAMGCSGMQWDAMGWGGMPWDVCRITQSLGCRSSMPGREWLLLRKMQQSWENPTKIRG